MTGMLARYERLVAAGELQADPDQRHASERLDRLQKDLEADIHKLPGIMFIETSLISKTLVLNYDAHKLSLEEVDHILHKWGCGPGESSFHNLVSMK